MMTGTLGGVLIVICDEATVEGAIIQDEARDTLNLLRTRRIQNRRTEGIGTIAANAKEGVAEVPCDDVIDKEAIRNLHMLGRPWRPQKTRSLPKTPTDTSGS
jgi:hypothetical protein